LKNLHYFYGKKPAWNPQKKRWEIEIDLLPKIIFAFPDFELSPSLLSRFPSIKEIQENGTRAIAYIDSTIQECASEHLHEFYLQYNENPEKNYDSAIRIILGNSPIYAEVEPKIKELAWKMGFSKSNWKKPE
jgi:DNA repair photolyase